MRPPADFDPDVVIVGSGATGSLSAYALARAGVKVLLVEAGRAYDPYTETAMFQWEREAPLAGVATPDKPFSYYFAEAGGGWDIDGEPYTTGEGSSFRWWRSRMLGGRTNHWGRISLRMGEYDIVVFVHCGSQHDPWDTLQEFHSRHNAPVGEPGRMPFGAHRYVGDPEMDEDSPRE